MRYLPLATEIDARGVRFLNGDSESAAALARVADDSGPVFVDSAAVMQLSIVSGQLWPGGHGTCPISRPAARRSLALHAVSAASA